MAEMKEYPVDGNIKEKVQWIIDIDSNALLKDYGKISIEPKNDLQDLQRLLSHYMETFEQHPDWFSDEAIGYLDNISERIKETFDPDLSSVNAGTIAEQCCYALQQGREEIADDLNQHTVDIILNQTNETKTADTEAFRQQMADALSDAQNRSEQIDKISKQIEQTLSGVTSETSREGIAKEAVHFQTEAERHHRNALFWLGAVGVVSAALIGTAAYFHFFDAPPIDSAGSFNWNHYVPRFSILALLIFFDAVLIGIYKAELHNEIVNTHRANALKTFQTMTAATLTQDVKDAVTLTAAGAIYAPQETGYSKRGAAQQINVAEMLANIAANK